MCSTHFSSACKEVSEEGYVWRWSKKPFWRCSVFQAHYATLSPGEDDDGTTLMPWESRTGFPTPVSGVDFRGSYIFIKEKTMDEYTMPELHLSEELLQQITGGCKECNRDKLVTIDHYMCCGLHNSHADLAKSNNQYDQYDFHNKNSISHLKKGLDVIQRIEQREATPGHVILPEPQLPPGRRWIM
jgi:hypothetical protein